ncbi:MAG: hypothetical protein R3C45_19795 [Phycisphaerales bacterium]
MKIPEHIRIDLALRRAARFGQDHFASHVAMVLLAIAFGLGMILFLLYAFFSQAGIHRGMMYVM